MLHGRRRAIAGRRWGHAAISLIPPWLGHFTKFDSSVPPLFSNINRRALPTNNPQRTRDL
jgi:hypothetical protein